MPIYEYLCNDCGHRFEIMRSMKDADAPVSCKICESQRTKRALSVFFASSEGRAVTAKSGGSCSGGCSGCGGSCGSCGH